MHGIILSRSDLSPLARAGLGGAQDYESIRVVLTEIIFDCSCTPARHSRLRPWEHVHTCATLIFAK